MDLETRKRAVDVIAQLVVGGSDKGYFTVLDELLDMIGYESLERERDELKRQLAEANAKIEREVAARNSLSIQLDHMKGLWDERGNEICTLKANLAEANAELDMMTELMRKQNAAFAEMREALGLAWGLIESDCRDLLDNCALNQGETICTADKSYCETACDEVRLLHLVPKALSSVYHYEGCQKGSSRKELEEAIAKAREGKP